MKTPREVIQSIITAECKRYDVSENMLTNPAHRERKIVSVRRLIFMLIREQYPHIDKTRLSGILNFPYYAGEHQWTVEDLRHMASVPWPKSTTDRDRRTKKRDDQKMALTQLQQQMFAQYKLTPESFWDKSRRGFNKIPKIRVYVARSEFIDQAMKIASLSTIARFMKMDRGSVRHLWQNREKYRAQLTKHLAMLDQSHRVGPPIHRPTIASGGHARRPETFNSRA